MVTEDWYFWSHRSPLALAAIQEDYEVLVATRGSEYKTAFHDAGIRQIPLRLSRSSLNPLSELRSFWQIYQIYRQEQPDLVHHVALKPIVYGSIAARLTNVPAVVNAIAGLGTIFTAQKTIHQLRRLIFVFIYRLVLSLNKNSMTIIQNPDDRDELVKNRILNFDCIRLIRSSGVDINYFFATPLPQGPITVMLASRLLWNKGVGEFIAAARLLQSKKYRFVLVGSPDEENPTSVPMKSIKEWVENELAEWWGYRNDMSHVLTQAHIVVLPSYREGFPKVLLEAAACARPLIATDVPGCREIVIPGRTGLLVPPHDARMLAEAISTLAQNPRLLKEFGQNARNLVVQQFSQERIVAQTLALYQEMFDQLSNESKGMTL